MATVTAAAPPQRTMSYMLGLLFVLTLGNGIIGFDRQTVAFLAPFIVKDMGLNNAQVGWLAAGLSLAIALSSFFGSQLADRSGKLKAFLVTATLLFSLLSGASGLALLSAARRDRVTPEVRGIGAGAAAALATVDLVYVTRRRISKVYLLDAVAESAIVVAWLRARRATAAASSAGPASAAVRHGVCRGRPPASPPVRTARSNPANRPGRTRPAPRR